MNNGLLPPVAFEGRLVKLRPVVRDDYPLIFTWRIDAYSMHLWSPQRRVPSFEEFIPEIEQMIRGRNGPYIHNGKAFAILQSAYVADPNETTVSTPPKNQSCLHDGNSCYPVSLPASHNTQLCYRAYWATEVYHPSLAALSPFSKYACVVRGSGTSYRWYGTSDRAGNVYVRMYNGYTSGSHTLYDAKITWTDGTEISSACSQKVNIPVGGAPKQCNFARAGSGVVRTWARPLSPSAEYVYADVAFGP